MPRRKKNPLEKVAVVHNKGVAYVYDRIKDSNGELPDDVPISVIIEHTIAFLRENHAANKTNSDFNLSYELLASRIERDDRKSIQEFLTAQGVPKPLIDIVSRIKRLAEDPPLGMIEAYAEVQRLEKEMLDSNFSDQETAYPLLYVAIAKGSLKFAIIQSEMRAASAAYEIEFHWPWEVDASAVKDGLFLSPLELLVTEAISPGMIVAVPIVQSVRAAVKERKRVKEARRKRKKK